MAVPGAPGGPRTGAGTQARRDSGQGWLGRTRGRGADGLEALPLGEGDVLALRGGHARRVVHCGRSGENMYKKWHRLRCAMSVGVGLWVGKGAGK